MGTVSDGCLNHLPHTRGHRLGSAARRCINHDRRLPCRLVGRPADGPNPPEEEGRTNAHLGTISTLSTGMMVIHDQASSRSGQFLSSLSGHNAERTFGRGQIRESQAANREQVAMITLQAVADRFRYWN
jgi:hypothetical protein